jgi:hypothetical protein
MSAPPSSERLRGARRNTWIVLAGGVLLILAGGAEVLTSDAGPLVLAGAVALLTGIAICVLAERRLSRIAYAMNPPRMRRDWSGIEARESDTLHWAAIGWFGGGGSEGGGGSFWGSFGGGDFGGGGGGDGGGGGGGG